jgi:heterodisulfide reductase subunit B
MPNEVTKNQRLKVSYYPGCTLKGTAKEFDESTSEVCKALDIELVEIPDWNCCGATSAHVTNEYLSFALPARNLMLAQEMGQDIVVPCAACFNRLKFAEKEILNKKHKETGYRGDIRIMNLLDLLSQDETLKRIEKKIKKRLKGLKAVTYYGCLISRPPKITDIKNYENPEDMDKIITALGVSCLPWSYKTDCCGASLALTRTDITLKLVHRLFEMALEAGAECMVVACSLCHANLDTRQQEIADKYGKEYYIPIFYFTELMGLAMGHDVTPWFRGHLVDPTRLLKSKGLM